MLYFINIIIQEQEVPIIKNSDLKKLEKQLLSYAVIFIQDADECRVCESTVDELAEVADELSPLIDIYQFDCSKSSNQNTCERYGVTKFPMLKIFNHNGQTPAPQEFFGNYESAEMNTFIKDRIREPFFLTNDTDVMIDYMLTKALTGVHFFFHTPAEKPEDFFYKLGKKYFGKINMIVHPNFDREEWEKYSKITFQDKIEIGEISGFAGINGTVQFFPFTMSADEPDMIDQWIKELLEYALSGKIKAAPEDDDSY